MWKFKSAVWKACVLERCHSFAESINDGWHQCHRHAVNAFKDLFYARSINDSKRHVLRSPLQFTWEPMQTRGQRSDWEGLRGKGAGSTGAAGATGAESALFHIKTWTFDMTLRFLIKLFMTNLFWCNLMQFYSMRENFGTYCNYVFKGIFASP